MTRRPEDLRQSGGLLLVQADAQRLPLTDRSVDVAMAMHMLYHVPDIPAAIGELPPGSGDARPQFHHAERCGHAGPGILHGHIHLPLNRSGWLLELAAGAGVEDYLGHGVGAQAQFRGYLVRAEALLVVQPGEALL